jgi:hypothetical protein
MQRFFRLNGKNGCRPGVWPAVISGRARMGQEIGAFRPGSQMATFFWDLKRPQCSPDWQRNRLPIGLPPLGELAASAKQEIRIGSIEYTPLSKSLKYPTDVGLPSSFDGLRSHGRHGNVSSPTSDGWDAFLMRCSEPVRFVHSAGRATWHGDLDPGIWVSDAAKGRLVFSIGFDENGDFPPKWVIAWPPFRRSLGRDSSRSRATPGTARDVLEGTNVRHGSSRVGAERHRTPGVTASTSHQRPVDAEPGFGTPSA